jgi:dolichol-phosphate mannosyltransferase
MIGKRITDGTNGFRAFKTSIFKSENIRLDQDWLDRYELEPYLIYKVIKSGYKLKEVPITIKYHQDGSYTKMKPFKGWWSLARPIFYLTLGIRR